METELRLTDPLQELADEGVQVENSQLRPYLEWGWSLSWGKKPLVLCEVTGNSLYDSKIYDSLLETPRTRTPPTMPTASSRSGSINHNSATIHT